MSRYKAGYSERHSPFYDAGLADGQADRDADEPRGMDAERAWSAMYQRGYADGLAGGEGQEAG
jgi:hypothetical protein